MASKYHSVRVKKRPGKTRSAKVRSKTFSSEKSAKNWAETQGIAKYTLENLRSADAETPKFRVIAE